MYVGNQMALAIMPHLLGHAKVDQTLRQTTSQIAQVTHAQIGKKYDEKSNGSALKATP